MSHLDARGFMPTLPQQARAGSETLKLPQVRLEQVAKTSKDTGHRVAQLKERPLPIELRERLRQATRKYYKQIGLAFFSLLVSTGTPKIQRDEMLDSLDEVAIESTYPEESITLSIHYSEQELLRQKLNLKYWRRQEKPFSEGAQEAQEERYGSEVKEVVSQIIPTLIGQILKNKERTLDDHTLEILMERAMGDLKEEIPEYFEAPHSDERAEQVCMDEMVYIVAQYASEHRDENWSRLTDMIHTVGRREFRLEQALSHHYPDLSQDRVSNDILQLEWDVAASHGDEAIVSLLSFAAQRAHDSDVATSSQDEMFTRAITEHLEMHREWTLAHTDLLREPQHAKIRNAIQSSYAFRARDYRLYLREAIDAQKDPHASTAERREAIHNLPRYRRELRYYSTVLARLSE